MHVGIVSPCSSGPLADLLAEPGGIDLGCGAHFMATLVRALVDRGHRVSVVTLSPDVKERRILEGANLTYYAYPARTRRKMRDLFKLERQGLREGILLAQPDILHAHWTYEFAMACLENGLPTLITSHDNAFQQLRFSRDLYRLGRLYLQIRIIRKTQFLTAVSPYLANSLRWLAKAEIEVIPNPICVLQTDRNISENGSGAVRIATVLNGWGNRKNAKTAIRAFNLLCRKVPDAEMFMFGYDFEEQGPASQWTECKKLNHNIHFCGFLPPYELQKKLEKISILLHPALEESFGMAIAEAMALGLPVVAGTRAGAVPWVLDEGRAGFLTDVRDPEKIAQALLACIQETEIRRERQRKAYERVLNLFSAEAVAEQYERSYQKVLSQC